MPTARHVMGEKRREVHHIHPDDSMLNALRIMAEHEIGPLVVLDDGYLAGIITERDYARKIAMRERA